MMSREKRQKKWIPFNDIITEKVPTILIIAFFKRQVFGNCALRPGWDRSGSRKKVLALSLSSVQFFGSCRIEGEMLQNDAQRRRREKFVFSGVLFGKKRVRNRHLSRKRLKGYFFLIRCIK